MKFTGHTLRKNRRRQVILASLIFFALQGHSQQYNTWYFGSGAGISFNTGAATLPYVLPDGINDLYEGNASMCDSAGNILFYTNGKTVYNKLHGIMLNGDGLMGNKSAAQSSLIIPVPNNDSIYYIFTTDAVENNFVNGYRYSIVNIKHDAGKGEVISKNVLLNASCTERLAAARHANGLDIWIIGNEKNSNVFKAWLMTCTGFQTTPIVSTVGTVLNNEDLGTMKVSPDGKLLCQTNYPDLAGNFFQLFDFDKSTGMLSNARTISNAGVAYYGCEFSPDSKLLYITRGDTFIDQFEPALGTVAAINGSRVTIPAGGGFYGIQTGPDGKIYLNRNTGFLSVINNPNIKGAGCNFETDKIDLKKNGALGLPSAINDGPIDPFNDFTWQITDSCNGTILFNGQTNIGGTLQWTWDFGDGNTSTLQNPLHTFNPPDQVYNVRVKVKSLTACGSVERTRPIAPHGLNVNADFDFVPKCDSGYVRFINKSIVFPADANIQYLWDFGDGNTSNDKEPIHSFAGSGLFTVKLTINTGSTCLDDFSSTDLNLQQLDIHAPPPQTIDAGQTVQLFVTGGGSGFQWSPPQWLDNPNISNPIARPQDNITYYVTATNDAGCKDVDSVIIHVNPIDGIYVPSAFTPGSDGKNDIIKPILGVRYTLKEFTIFNRWGQKVFSTKEYGKGWDGMLNGQLQMTGTYVWTIRVTDAQQKIITKKGTVTLIR